MTLNLRIRIIVWWKGKLKGGGGTTKGKYGWECANGAFKT